MGMKGIGFMNMSVMSNSIGYDFEEEWKTKDNVLAIWLLQQQTDPPFLV